jgi:hypothetical protein
MRAKRNDLIEHGEYDYSSVMQPLRKQAYFGTFLILASSSMKFTPERIANAKVPLPK